MQLVVGEVGSSIDSIFLFFILWSLDKMDINSRYSFYTRNLKSHVFRSLSSSIKLSIMPLPVAYSVYPPVAFLFL